MFSEACQRVSAFTRPLIISTRHQDGRVSAECASFIVLNDEGWIITAGHVFDSFVRFQTDQNKIREVEELNARRSGDRNGPENQIKLDPNFITNHSFWWGWDGVILNNVYVNRQVDFAVGKLEPFDPSWVSEYPVLADPDHSLPGTSLCRSGYSFLEISSTFDEGMKAFRIPKIDHKSAMFPNDGILTRVVNSGRSSDGEYDMRYVETSTPGLKGQSGGPLFDVRGRIHGMQVRTAHFPLGFHPTVEYEGQRIVENQFLNVGVAVGSSTLRQILDSRGVRYTAEGDESGYRIVG